MMNEISISKATDLPREFGEALERWRVEVIEILESGEVQWYSKLVSTTFSYGGKRYVVSAGDVFSKELRESCPENYLDAALELLQPTISVDLGKLGAENIRNWGFLD